MKILAIGDFHGKVNSKLKKIPRDIDLILCVGDLADTRVLRDIQFKYWNLIKKETEKIYKQVLGEKKYFDILKKTNESMYPPLKFLESFKKPVFLVYGNSDFLDKNVRKIGAEGLESMCRENENLILLKTNYKKFDNLTIAGFSGYRGAMSKGLTKTDKKQKEKVKKINSEWENRLNGLFQRVQYQENVIFLAHDVPRGYFDRVNYKKSPLHNKHVGDEYFTKYIKRYQPDLFICGHMHEYQGVKVLGKTKIITTGSAAEGKAVIIDIDKRIKVRFI